MKSKGLRVKYNKEGNDVVEEYHSHMEFAKHYNVSVPTVKYIIDGTSKFKFFPEGVVFEDAEIPLQKEDKVKIKEVSKYYWICPYCQKKMLLGSKINHLNSKKHRDLNK